jgi:diguanylate cyclase
VVVIPEILVAKKKRITERFNDGEDLARLLTIIAVGIAMFVAIVTPTAYFLLTKTSEIRESTLEARLHAAFVSTAINNSTGDWRNQVIGLIANNLNITELPEMRLIVDRNGIEVDRAGNTLSGYVIQSKAPIESAQGVVGYVLVRRSLEPLLIDTGILATLSSALGILIYLILRTLPLRALRKTLFELKKSEAKARVQVEENLKTVFESTPDGIIVCSPAGLIQSCNPSATRLLGFSENELQRMFLSDLLHGSSPMKDLKRLSAIQCEVILRRRNGGCRCNGE